MPATPHIRLLRAQHWDTRPFAPQTPNGDETRYADLRASFAKGLDHDGDGHVDESDFDLMVTALTRGSGGQGADGLDTLPLGTPGGRRLISPKAGLGVELIGGDPKHYAIPPAPRFASEEVVAEIVENYWMARLRDVAFGDYDGHPLVAEAVADLTAMGEAFKGPTPSARTLFRGTTPGEGKGPYVSQFLMHRVPFGAQTIVQTMKTLPPQDYLTNWDDWLAVQRGVDPPPVQPGGSVWIHNGRDIGQWVHIDQLYQAYFLACLFLLEYKKNRAPAFSADNPYAAGMAASQTQDAFATFGGPHILSLLTEVATRALKAVWYQKWVVHRRLRPEVFAGRIHFDRARGGNGRYDIAYGQLDLATNLVGHLEASGNWLLPMAFPEGSPTHPAYGAGHATVAGACTTILKAWFDGATRLSELTDPFVSSGVFRPLEATPDGASRRRYEGADKDDLTIEGELNKIAANIGIGRNIAGVHWRSDHAASLALGEQVAIDTLTDYVCTYEEAFAGFRLRKFDGTSGRVGKEGFRADATPLAA